MRWLSILLAGCNFVYGLDETTIAPPDPDGDQIFGADDNCPAIANVDQDDGDNDGVGDACDTCPTVRDPTNHDEDGDHFGDACDVCATEPDFQDDDDSDGVGDSCDSDLVLGATLSSMLVFDSFFTLDDARWARTGEWDHLADSLSPRGTSTLTLRDGNVDGAFFNIDLGIEASRPWTTGDAFGVRLVDNGTVTMRCEVRCTDVCRFYMENEGQSQPPRVVTGTRPLVQLRARVTPNGSQGDFAFACALDTVIAGLIQSATVNPRGIPEITAGGDIDLRFIGAWKHLPR